MKKHSLLSLIAAMAVVGTSCYSEHGSVHTKRSAVLGGIVGAGAGALIGEHNDRELEGAAVGGVLGAITGGVLGSARDESYYRQGQRTYSSAPPYRSYPAPSSYRSNGYSSGYGYGQSYNSGHYHYYPPVRRTVYRSSSYCR